MSRINQALLKIEQAGFTLSVDGPDIVVNPPGKLSPAQRQFIVDHKAAIMSALLEASQSGNDHPSANDHQARPHVAVEELPDRLVSAAVRVCREVHQDGDQAVQEMLVDLTWSDPKDWNALIDHFEAQLPPAPPKPIPPMVQCGGCSHAEPNPNHPAITHCRVGVESGAATEGWFDTDLHLCDRREVRTPGKTINEEPTC